MLNWKKKLSLQFFFSKTVLWVFVIDTLFSSSRKVQNLKKITTKSSNIQYSLIYINFTNCTRILDIEDYLFFFFTGRHCFCHVSLSVHQSITKVFTWNSPNILNENYTKLTLHVCFLSYEDSHNDKIVWLFHYRGFLSRFFVLFFLQ